MRHDHLSSLDAAHAAHLVDDILTATGATQEDRQAVADHLTGRSHLGLCGTSHDSWALVTGVARAWHAYTRRAGVPARVLPRFLDGEMGTVTACMDADVVSGLLEGVEGPPADLGQVRAFTAWLEPQDVYDDNEAARRLRRAWARFRALRLTAQEPAPGGDEDSEQPGARSRAGRTRPLAAVAEEFAWLVLQDITASDVTDEYPDLATDDAEQVAALVRDSAGSRPDDARVGAAWAALAEEAGL